MLSCILHLSSAASHASRPHAAHASVGAKLLFCVSLWCKCAKDNGGGMAEGQEREARERHEAQLRRQQQTYEEQQHLAVLEHRSWRVHAEMQQRRARVQHGLNRL